MYILLYKNGHKQGGCLQKNEGCGGDTIHFKRKYPYKGKEKSMQKLMEMKNKKGFTLIEMLIVILIIVILLAIAVPAVAGYRRDALRTQDEGAIESIRTAIEAAVIRATPEYSTYYGHRGTDLDYADLVSLSTTHADGETREFYGLLADYLGPNFQGNFSFHYMLTYGEHDHIYWVSYWRSDALGQDDDSIMLYHNTLNNWGPDINAAPGTNGYFSYMANNMCYLQELLDAGYTGGVDIYRA